MNYRKAGKWMLLNFIYTKDSEPFFSSHADLGCSTRNALKLKICTTKMHEEGYQLDFCSIPLAQHTVMLDVTHISLLIKTVDYITHVSMPK